MHGGWVMSHVIVCNVQWDPATLAVCPLGRLGPHHHCGNAAACSRRANLAKVLNASLYSCAKTRGVQDEGASRVAISIRRVELDPAACPEMAWAQRAVRSGPAVRRSGVHGSWSIRPFWERVDLAWLLSSVLLRYLGPFGPYQSWQADSNWGVM